MCTVSWLARHDGYHLLFNRDEQRSRSEALIPQVFELPQCKVIMPIDPDGNGSWIASNEFRLSICLLNYYQGEKPNNVLISRGLLLKELSIQRTPSELAKALLGITLTNYAPFSLLVLGYESDERLISTLISMLWIWDGKALTKTKASNPFTSSSVEFDKVRGARMQLADVMLNKSKLQDHIDYHQSHQPSKGYLSVCMHRGDAKSVSLSHIAIGEKWLDFNYKNGSPCADMPLSNVRLAPRPLTL